MNRYHKISIIVPVYNVENFLSQCLDSIINQTYQNLEIILINDGSTDSCKDICNQYAKKDSRIKIVNKENGGLSDARNSGLKDATGDFVVFVDSDDLLSIDFCEKLLSHATKNNADIVECNYTKFKREEDLNQDSNTFNSEIEIHDTAEALKSLMHQNLKQVVWNKLYRKEVINNIQFPIGRINEDEFWTYKIFGNAKKVIKIPDFLYFYRQQEGSIMGRNYNINRLDGLIAMYERINYMKTNFPKLENLAIKVFCTGSLWHYQKLYRQPNIDPAGMYRKRILNSVKRFNRKSIFTQWKLKEILWYQFFMISPNTCVKFRNYINIGI